MTPTPTDIAALLARQACTPLHEGSGEESNLPDDLAAVIRAQARRIVTLEAESANFDKEKQLAIDIVSDRRRNADARATAAEAERNRLQSGVVGEIAAERRRQIEVEGWTPEHDDKHDFGEMAYAAASYVLQANAGFGRAWLRDIVARLWPWDNSWWKPGNGKADGKRRCLIKAGALIVAEVERRDRLAAPTASTGGVNG